MPIIQFVANQARRQSQKPVIVRNALNQQPRVVQEFAEVGIAAGPRVQQAFVEIGVAAGPRVVQEYAELGVAAGPRVFQSYVEWADVVPVQQTAVRPMVMRWEVEMLVEVATDSPDDDVPEPDPTPEGPSPDIWVKRVIRDVPDAVLDARGMPVEEWKDRSSWGADEVVDWGRLKLVVGGRDVTFWRGVPMVPLGWSKAQPFGDLTAEFRFPQVTPFEAYPPWLGDPEAGEFKNVDLYQLHPDRTTKDKLWEGIIVSFEDDVEGLTVQCIGAMYQLDFYLRRAKLAGTESHRDISLILRDLVTPWGREMRTVRFAPLAVEPATVGGLPTIMGIDVTSHGDWNPLLTGYVSELLSLAWVEDGSTQWTIDKDVGRRPVLRLKDVHTQHYSIHIGEQGVEHDLRLDLTQQPTTVFGEGTDLDTCRWYNAKYPNQRVADAPVFFGTPIGPPPDSAHNDSMLLWEQEMHDRGWTSIVPDGTYSTDEEFWVRRFQAVAGLTVDGVVGPQTWAATFLNGDDAGDLDAPYIAPLYSKPEVELYLRAPDGSKAGKNPAFDKRVLRIERYENFGSSITKRDGIRSAELEVGRDWPASYFGTITLHVDPPEKSRFELLEGRNILVRGHRGADRLMHIARVDVDWEDQSCTLTVDERFRDAMTLGAMLRRDRDADDPARRKVVTRRNRSHDIQDQKPVWDCENGAGIIPRFAVTAGTWSVIRIPAGKLGTVVGSRLETVSPGVPSRMAWGIFDRAVTPNQLQAVGAPDPEAGHPLFFSDDGNDGFWDQFGPELLIAWGSFEEPGGFSPGRESEDDPLTGVTEDNAQWYFESTRPPWLWVAIWVETGNSTNVNYVKGLLQPSNETS